MSTLRLAAALSGLIVAAAATGCTNQPATPPAATPAAARATPDLLPPAVSSVFGRDYPDAGITNVSQLSAETGQPLYRITFINNGTPGAATYFHTGERLPQPGLNTNDTPDPRATTPGAGGTVTPGATGTTGR